MTYGDQEFLLWLVDRLIHVYGESSNADFVRRLHMIATQDDYLTTIPGPAIESPQAEPG